MKRQRNNGYAYRMQVGDARRGETLSQYLARKYQHSTQQVWQCRLEAGELAVDGQLAREDDIVRNGVCVVWNRPGWLEPATPQSFSVEYEDDAILVVGKPSGLPTLPGGGYYANTLLHRVREQFEACHPVHRLGTATSGLVLFAKSNEIARKLSSKWSEATKRYLAIVQGDAGESEYDIRQPIGKIPHPRLGTVHGASDSGKSARTMAKPIQKHFEWTLMEASLCTGRPHQIRIHMAAIGHPLVGDPMYASGGRLLRDPGKPSDGGYFLHAHELAFAHPETSEPCHFRLSAPVEFTRTIGASAEAAATKDPP